MLEKDNGITFEGREPSTLFREFAAECMELAQRLARRRVGMDRVDGLRERLTLGRA